MTSSTFGLGYFPHSRSSVPTLPSGFGSYSSKSSSDQAQANSTSVSSRRSNWFGNRSKRNCSNDSSEQAARSGECVIMTMHPETNPGSGNSYLNDPESGAEMARL